MKKTAPTDPLERIGLSASPHSSTFLQDNLWQICFGMGRGDEAELCHVLFLLCEKQEAAIVLPHDKDKAIGSWGWSEKQSQMV